MSPRKTLRAAPAQCVITAFRHAGLLSVHTAKLVLLQALCTPPLLPETPCQLLTQLAAPLWLTASSEGPQVS